jgi:DNA processing protein
VESAADILAAVPAVAPPDENKRHEADLFDDENPDIKKKILLDRSNEERLLHSISKTPVDPDELARHVSLDPATVQRLLLHLEMAGRIERDSLGRYTRL